MRRPVASILVALVVALTVAACGGGSRASVPVKLTLLVVSESWPGYEHSPQRDGGRALFHLKCDPASGNVADPAKACAAIAAQPSLVTNPKPYRVTGEITGPPITGYFTYFTITGSVHGKAVHFSGPGIWGTDVPLVAKLGLARRYGKPVVRLEPRRYGSVAMNHTRRFAPGMLRSGDLVTCRTDHSYKGPPLAMSVPVERGNREMISTTPGLMAIIMRADSTVLASCLGRDRMPLDKRGRTTDPKNWPPKSLR